MHVPSCLPWPSPLLSQVDQLAAEVAQLRNANGTLVLASEERLRALQAQYEDLLGWAHVCFLLLRLPCCACRAFGRYALSCCCCRISCCCRRQCTAVAGADTLAAHCLPPLIYKQAVRAGQRDAAPRPFCGVGEDPQPQGAAAGEHRQLSGAPRRMVVSVKITAAESQLATTAIVDTCDSCALKYHLAVSINESLQ